jgi:predicted DNA-binding transcriptional regulator AlpA
LRTIEKKIAPVFISHPSWRVRRISWFAAKSGAPPDSPPGASPDSPLTALRTISISATRTVTVQSAMACTVTESPATAKSFVGIVEPALNRIVRLAEAAAELNVSRETLYRWERDGRIMRRRNFGPRTRGWLRGELDRWIASAWIELRKKKRPDRW